MPTLSNEELKERIRITLGLLPNSTPQLVDNLFSLFATQNTALLKELLANIPKKVDVVDDPFGEKQLSYINYREQGYNQAVDETIEVINSKLAAMGEQ